MIFPRDVTCAWNRFVLLSVPDEYHMTSGAAVEGGMPVVASVSMERALVVMGATVSVPGTDSALSDGSRSTHKGVRPSFVAVRVVYE